MLDNLNTYYTTEEIKKWYYINVKNEFETKESASWYIQDPLNYSKFEEFNEYFVQGVYIKTQQNKEIKDGF